MVVTTRTVAPCYICVLAPSVSSPRTALDYRPFGNKPLGTILQAATESARECAGPLCDLMFDHYEISEAFFFGQRLTNDAVGRLITVPSGIIDCDIFETETSAISDAQQALFAFGRDPGKVLYRIPRTPDCRHLVIPPALVIKSDTQLQHVLEAHLWSRQRTELMVNHVDRR